LLDSLAPGSATPAAAPPASATPPAEGQAPAAEAPAEPGVSPAGQAVISDLHWLIHQGHVIEFANGILETAKKPLPRPPRPERQPKPEAGAAEQHAEAEVTTQEGVVAGEGTDAETAGAPAAEHPAETATVQHDSGATAGADLPAPQQFPVSSETPPQPEEVKTQ
jgi:hypothetical protein